MILLLDLSENFFFFVKVLAFDCAECIVDIMLIVI